MESVEGKVVLITGGAGAIGLSMTKKLLSSGAKGIAIVDIVEAAPFVDDRVIFIKADITNKDEFKAAFETTVLTYRQLDIVINNAGIVDDINWEKTLAVNLGAVIQGSYFAMQDYLPKYKSEPEGVIVNTASILGFEVLPTPIYCATKHGVVGLGRALGCEEYYKKYKVRVLTLCPGVVDTPMIKGNSVANIHFPDTVSEDLKTLSRVFQSPERVAEALIHVIKHGKTGSLWVTEDEEPVYEVKVPHRHTMRV